MREPPYPPSQFLTFKDIGDGQSLGPASIGAGDADAGHAGKSVIYGRRIILSPCVIKGCWFDETAPAAASTIGNYQFNVAIHEPLGVIGTNNYYNPNGSGALGVATGTVPVGGSYSSDWRADFATQVVIRTGGIYYVTWQINPNFTALGASSNYSRNVRATSVYGGAPSCFYTNSNYSFNAGSVPDFSASSFVDGYATPGSWDVGLELVQP